MLSNLLRGAFAGSTALGLSACVNTQLNGNTTEYISNLNSIYTKDVLHNLSKFIDNPSAIPSHVTFNAGTSQITNTINPSISFPLSAQIANSTAKALTSATLTTGTTLSGAGAGISDTNITEENYQFVPLTDANTLRNFQIIYRHAVHGTPITGNYVVPRVFIAGKFYHDPYLLQEPHCVLCAKEQGIFKMQDQQTYVNNKLKARWLLWDVSDDTDGNLIDLGHFGNHELFMNKSDYYAGVLSDLVFFTLPNSIPAETFAATQPSPAPGGPLQPTPTTHPTPSPAQPPATNFRMLSPERQNNFFVPQGILPTQ